MYEKAINIEIVSRAVDDSRLEMSEMLREFNKQIHILEYLILYFGLFGCGLITGIAKDSTSPICSLNGQFLSKFDHFR